MAKPRYQVERVNPRGENPGEKLQTQIEQGAAQGNDLVTVIPLFDEILLVWKTPAREQRG